MRKIRYILILFCALCASTQAQQRYVGGDISLLPKYEQYNSAYKDAYGSSISNLLTWFIADCGWNTFRVRLFVNPQQKAANGNPDPAVCQDLAYVTALGQRIKAAGAYFLLDFHYSDTWVDALNIQAPAAWSGTSADAMADSLQEKIGALETELDKREAFIGAFAAKEVFVAQMGIVYRAGDVEEDDSSLRDIMAKNYTPLQGVCILLFALIATPCMATFAVMAREAGSWKWAFAQWFTLTAMAWVICTIVYQVGIHFVS